MPRFSYCFFIAFLASLSFCQRDKVNNQVYLPSRSEDPFNIQGRLLEEDDISPTIKLTSNLHRDTLRTKNQTFELSSSLFDKKVASYAIELELNMNNSEYESIQLVFALSKSAALQLNPNTHFFSADLIDVEAFFLRKKYFRIDLNSSYYIQEPSYPLFLTIFQNQLPAAQISYTLLITKSSTESSKQCPFECLNQGICNTQTGQCKCRPGLFDHDCSRSAVSLDPYRQSASSPSSFQFSWEAFLSQSHRQSFFYETVSPQNLEGYLYLNIVAKSSAKSIIKSDSTSDLQVFYSTQPRATGGSDDKAFLKKSFTCSQSSLENGIDLFLEKIENQNRRQLLNSSLTTEQISYLVGLIQEGHFIDSNKSMNYKLKLEIRSTGPDSDKSSALQLNATIIIMGSILVLLIIFLVLLLFCLHRRMATVNAVLERRASKKLKQEQSEQEILDLLPIEKFTEELKNTLMQQNDNEEPTCSVCLCEFEPDESIRRTYCPHYFHSECLVSWLKKQKNCPHCRNSMTPRSIASKSSAKEITPIAAVAVTTATTNVQKIPLKKMNNNQYIQQIDEETRFDSNNSPIWFTNGTPENRSESTNTNLNNNKGQSEQQKKSKFSSQQRQDSSPGIGFGDTPNGIPRNEPSFSDREMDSQKNIKESEGFKQRDHFPSGDVSIFRPISKTEEHEDLADIQKGNNHNVQISTVKSKSTVFDIEPQKQKPNLYFSQVLNDASDQN